MTTSATKSVKLSVIIDGDYRLEASTYLREGYGLSKLAKQTPGCTSLGKLADIWQPSRLTGYSMPDGQGLPFFTAGQMFEDFPRVRKWLAEPFVPQKEQRYVSPNWLLMSCSGVVGRITAVYPHHQGKIVTHDLLRIVPNERAIYGWLYAYLKTDFSQRIARASQYGHMIKHIEVAHANDFPVLMPEATTRDEIGEIVKRAIETRTRAWQLRDDAFALLERRLEIDQNSVSARAHNCLTVSHSDVFSNRARLDAGYYAGEVDPIDTLIKSMESSALGTVVKDVYLPNRFTRPYGDNGTPFATPNELFDVNVKPTKRVYKKLIANEFKLTLREGELLMVRSGQKYGMIGRAMMVDKNNAGLLGSDDPIRIVPSPDLMRSGYLLTFLNDPLVGRPYVVRNAYGTSVPHLSPDDIKRIRVPRLGDEAENAIADLMEQSVELSAEADRLENSAIEKAESVIASMLGATE